MALPIALHTALRPPKSSLVSQGLLVERMWKVTDVSLAYVSLFTKGVTVSTKIWTPCLLCDPPCNHLSLPVLLFLSPLIHAIRSSLTSSFPFVSPALPTPHSAFPYYPLHLNRENLKKSAFNFSEHCR